jgi:cytochrome c oxidase assembly protein subunit 15
VTLVVVTSRTWTWSPAAAPASDARPGLVRPAAAAAALVYVQLGIGALMRHTGAGLAIPDFPLAFGRVVPPLASFDVAVHFAHRVMAILVAGAVVWVAARAGRYADRLDLVLPARMAAVLVLVQIMLGAASVLSRLAVLPTTAHLVNGALILATLLTVALRASRGPLPAAGPAHVHGAQGIPA